MVELNFVFVFFWGGGEITRTKFKNGSKMGNFVFSPFCSGGGVVFVRGVKPPTGNVSSIPPANLDGLQDQSLNR